MYGNRGDWVSHAKANGLNETFRVNSSLTSEGSACGTVVKKSKNEQNVFFAMLMNSFIYLWFKYAGNDWVSWVFCCFVCAYHHSSISGINPCPGFEKTTFAALKPQKEKAKVNVIIWWPAVNKNGRKTPSSRKKIHRNNTSRELRKPVVVGTNEFLGSMSMSVPRWQSLVLCIKGMSAVSLDSLCCLGGSDSV